MRAAVCTSQLLKGLPVTKDTLYSLIGKPIHDSNGNTIGKVSGYTDNKEVIFLDLVEECLNFGPDFRELRSYALRNGGNNKC